MELECKKGIQLKKMTKPVYLDNQATTPVDPRVLKSMLPFYKQKFGNASSIHHIYGQECKKVVEQSREVLAKGLRSDKRNLIFTSGATESINLGIKGVMEKFEGAHHIITQETEHLAVLDSFKSIEKKGHEITILPVDSEGLVDPNLISESIRENTVLVSIMHANNEIGTIQRIDQIGEICHKRKVLFLVDACQSFGRLDIDVKKMKIDLLAASAHKIHGPQGIGLLYVNRKNPMMQLKMQINGGGHESGYRSGTLPVPLIVGFSKAFEICQSSRNEELEKLKVLRDRLYSGIKKKHTDVILNGSFKRRLTNNLNLCFPGIDAESIISKLKTIACSTASACSGMHLKPSHVIRALGRNSEQAFSSIRFSLGRFNTKREIDFSITEINKTIDNLKNRKYKR